MNLWKVVFGFFIVLSATQNDNVVGYLLTGREAGGGWLWSRLTRA